MQLLSNILPTIEKWKSEGQTIVFTNGCFDILHVGHVRYLSQAAALGDKLVVAINSDASVKRLGKGDDRPIHDQLARLEVIEALQSVSIAFIFDEETPLNAIKTIKPDVLTKGGDYDAEETNPDSKTYIVGSYEVKSFGGKVSTIDLVEGYSTTSAIDKLKAADRT